MTQAIIIIILVLLFIIGGMVTLLKTANKYKFPDNYDKSKTGFADKDQENDWPSAAKPHEPAQQTPGQPENPEDLPRRKPTEPQGEQK